MLYGLDLTALVPLFERVQEIQDDLSQVQQQMSRLSAERFLDQSGLVLPADASSEAAIIAADAAVSQEQALSGLQGVVQTWQQELVSFRQVSVLQFVPRP